MNKNACFEQLLDYCSQLPIINTHSHHLSDGQLENVDLDFILSNSYASWMSAPPQQDVDSRREYVLANRCNSYFRWLFKGLQELYGVEVVSENFDQLDSLIRSAYQNKAHHLDVLKQFCGYERVILDKYDHPGSDNGHGELFAPTYRINMFMNGYTSSSRDHNGNSPYDYFHSTKINSFDDYLSAMKTLIYQQKKSGAVALKNATAYERDQIYCNKNKDLASKAFNNPNATKEDARNFGDYILFEIAKLAEECSLPVQIHTGLGILDHTRAIGLRELLQAHPNVTFDLFHAGYPWTSDVLALLHNLKNVYVDLCWLPLLSTAEAKEFVKKALEISSAHRICWGCDTWVSEESTGAVLAIRHVLADALSDMILGGAMDMEYAQYIAKRILHDNAKELFAL